MAAQEEGTASVGMARAARVPARDALEGVRESRESIWASARVAMAALDGLSAALAAATDAHGLPRAAMGNSKGGAQQSGRRPRRIESGRRNGERRPGHTESGDRKDETGLSEKRGRLSLRWQTLPAQRGRLSACVERLSPQRRRLSACARRLSAPRGRPWACGERLSAHRAPLLAIPRAAIGTPSAAQVDICEALGIRSEALATPTEALGSCRANLSAI